MDLYSSLVGIAVIGAVVAAVTAVMSRLSDSSVIRLKSGQWTIGTGSASLAALVLAGLWDYFVNRPPEAAEAMPVSQFLSGHPLLLGIAAVALLSLLFGNTATH